MHAILACCMEIILWIVFLNQNSDKNKDLITLKIARDKIGAKTFIP